jgi:hypothetical protein
MSLLSGELTAWLIETSQPFRTTEELVKLDELP